MTEEELYIRILEDLKNHQRSGRPGNGMYSLTLFEREFRALRFCVEEQLKKVKKEKENG